MLFARIPLPYLPALVNWDTKEMEKTAQVNISLLFRYFVLSAK